MTEAQQISGLPIAGVSVRQVKVIPDERGKVFHMLRADDLHFDVFGEIYFSGVFEGAVKAWHIHRTMTLNYAVPHGTIDLVLYDDRPDSPTHGSLMKIRTGADSYRLITVPPMVWNGFKGIGSGLNIVANCASIPHDPTEIERIDPADPRIPYDGFRG